MASTLSTTGHGMILASKYVLPKLLVGPVYHCLSYFKYIELFKDLTTSDEDKESFEQAEGLLAPLRNDLERVCKRNARPGMRPFPLNYKNLFFCLTFTTILL